MWLIIQLVTSHTETVLYVTSVWQFFSEIFILQHWGKREENKNHTLHLRYRCTVVYRVTGGFFSLFPMISNIQFVHWIVSKHLADGVLSQGSQNLTVFLMTGNCLHSQNCSTQFLLLCLILPLSVLNFSQSWNIFLLDFITVGLSLFLLIIIFM